MEEHAQILKVQYKVLSGKLLQLMYFKAKQRLLNLKEQQLWKEYCEKEFGSSTQISLDSLATVEDLNLQTEKSKCPTSLNDGKLDSQSELPLTIPPVFPKRVIYQKSVFSKRPHKTQKAEVTALEVIKISRKDDTNKRKVVPNHNVKQDFSKQIRQKLKQLPTKDFTISRPNPKAVSFLLPQKLQEDRAIAWKAYLKSSPPRNQDQSKTPCICKSTQTNVITKDACESTRNNGSSNMGNNEMKEGRKDKKHSSSQSTQTIDKNDLITKVDIERVVNSLLEDLVSDTVQELNRLESRKICHKNTVELDTIWSQLHDLESKEEEIRRRWKSLHFKDFWTHSHDEQYLNSVTSLSTASPTIILNKGVQNEASNNNEVQKDDCSVCNYCKHSFESAHQKPIMFTKTSPIPKCDAETVPQAHSKRILRLRKHEIQAIEDYHHYQFLFKNITYGLSTTSCHSPVEKIPDALLEDIFVDIAAELTETPGDIVTHLYEQEFYPEKS